MESVKTSFLYPTSFVVTSVMGICSVRYTATQLVVSLLGCRVSKNTGAIHFLGKA